MSRFRTYLAVALIGVAGGASSPHSSYAQQLAEATHARGEISLVVDLSDRELHVLRGDEVVRSYSVAVGKPEHPTPAGEFSIRRVVWNPRWVPPDARWARGKRPRAPGDPRNPMGRVKIFFKEPDYYIHGTHEVDSLGQAESHGCVRMRNSEVMDLATIVMDAGGENRSPGWFRRVINRVRHTQEVRLSHPVRVKIRE
ncbi:MAG TPA: L,D-transpeptidase [Longimicrobiaceae bacterium]|nr:L,D-transpeptidase [Longimicrobiaceae bacterium]